jgi:REP-associated tyrosine transposase
MEGGALRRLTNVRRYGIRARLAKLAPPFASPFHRPHRKRPAHFPTVTVGFQSIIMFLTVCTRQQKALLANDQAAQLILESWQIANFWRVGRYVIMPEHIHLFCAPNTFPPQSLKNWIEYWRNRVTRAWRHRAQVPIWQREFWDRQLRRSESYGEKWQYVLNNPVCHGTCGVLRTGRIKANSMCSSGTIGECAGLAELAPPFVLSLLGL